MAGKKKTVTPKDCDRWDTPAGAIKDTGKPTAAQKKLADKINAERAKAAATKKTSAKKKK